MLTSVESSRRCRCRFSARQLRLGGARPPRREPVGRGGTDPQGAAQAVSDGIQRLGKVALAFESPIMLPVPSAGAEGWPLLGHARTGEGNRSWSAGAGSALTTGLVQMAWVLQEVAERQALAVTTQIQPWLTGAADLFVWEAFVSGPGKPLPFQVSQHAADAAAAADTFADRWTTESLDESDVTCDPNGSFNLAVAATMYAGLQVAPHELAMPLMVYRTQPAA